jgi:hypothetical protein
VLKVSAQIYNASINIVSEILQKSLKLLKYLKLLKHFLEYGMRFLSRDRAYMQQIEDRCKKMSSGLRM